MTKLEQAIAYFEDAIRESDEIISEYSEEFQKELTEQKKHFEVALKIMKKWNGEGEDYQINFCPICGRKLG